MKMRVRDTGEVVELPETPGVNRNCQSHRFFWCTLDIGHSGVHVAHCGDEPVAFWNDDDYDPTEVEPLEPTP